MARKGKEIQLQQEIETQEEWEDMLSKEGLCVIDVYQRWCGLCTGMVGNLRKYRNDLSDDLLIYYAAKADSVDALEKYRGHCEPCFLFYAGGVMVAVVRGANAPLILRTITEQLAQEHKVLDGQAERKEIKDTLITQLESMERMAEEEEEEEEEQLKEVSMVIIKPDAVQSGKYEEIIAEMKNRGIEILRQEQRCMTEEEVKNVYVHLQDEEYFNDLVTFMMSGECIFLAITKGKTGQNIIHEFRELIGPTEVEEAKEQAPDSIRAKFGQEKYMNAVHGSDSTDTAARELGFFFPDFVAPKVEGAPKLQRTLALIRPDAYKNHREEILQRIRESGFKVAMSKEIHLNKEQAEEFYKEHEGEEYYEELTDRMSSGPLLALGLAREEAVTGWREMLGPTKVDEAKEQQPESLRAQFVEEGASINMLHGSDSEESAQKEIEFFFPMEQTIAVVKPDAIGTKNEIIDKIHEAGFRIAARKETTLSREIAEEFYGDHKDKEYYNDLVDHMTSGPTLFMVLSREGAVDGWRSLIGPTDPDKAKEVDPDAIRSQYGTDPLKNAVHGASNPEHAKNQITKIFGELYFNKDGKKVLRKVRRVRKETEQEVKQDAGKESPKPEETKAEEPPAPAEKPAETGDATATDEQKADEAQAETTEDKPAEQTTEEETPAETPAETKPDSPAPQQEEPKPEPEAEAAPAPEPQQEEAKPAEEPPAEKSPEPEAKPEPEPEAPKAEEETKPEEAAPSEEAPAEEKKDEPTTEEEKPAEGGGE